MKPRRTISPSPHDKGAALVIVLAMLVLMTVLVATFFSSVTSDFSSAKAYSQGESAKQLADSAVNVVTAQIKDATAGFSRPDAASALDTSKRLAWASQPGLIRTWDDSGTAANSYKLFSSDNMVVPGTYDPAADLADITGGFWKAEPAIYADLNSPVLVRDDANGTIISDPVRPLEKYTASAPVIDPNNLVDAASLTPAGPANTLTYDSNSDGKPDIEGFHVSKSPSYDPSKAVSPANNPVPMPVKWLYVLQDGQLSSPVASGSNARFSRPGQPVPSAGNPVVGRIAFWADDETSKINVNTAAEGMFWDVPVCASLDEMSLAANPPAKGEYQRVPGHPAMTCLSPVLGGGILDINHGIVQASDVGTFRQNLKKIYDFTPRVVAGNAASHQGSQGGTAPIVDRNYAYAPLVGDLNPNPAGSGTQNIVIPKAIPNGSARLYSTVDDILFKPDRTLQDASVINAASLKQNRFFLTANSRAPEVTLFNTPRISLWPITWPYRSAHLLASSVSHIVPTGNGNPDSQVLSDLMKVPVKSGGTGKWMAPQEQLIAFCTQIGTGANPPRYFFQRQNPDDPSYDYTNIRRNREILARLRELTSLDVPGFGGSFASKYSTSGRDRILVDAFDSIRGLNLTTPGLNSSGTNSFLYSFSWVYFANDPSGTLPPDGNQPTWQVVPMKIDLGSGISQKSIGRFPILPEVALIFYATDRLDPYPVTASSPGPFDASKMITSTNPQTTQMRMVVYLSEFSPGTPFINPSYWVKATGNSFTVNGTSINFPASGGNLVQMRQAMWTSGLDIMNRFFTQQFAPHYPKSFNVGGPTDKAYRRWEFVSDPIPLTPQDGSTTFNFGGSVVTFDIYGPNPASQNDSAPIANGSATKIQSIQIDFARLNGPAAIPLAPRWIENQKVPDAAKTAGVPTTGTSTMSGTSTMWYAAGPHPEVAKSGIYLFQDEGFDSRASGSTNPAVLSNKKISPNWQLRMVCASSINASYAAVPPANMDTPPIPNLPLLSSNSVPYPAYYPANKANNNCGDTSGSMFYGATSVITPYDTVLSMAIDPSGPAKGDARVLSALANISSDYYAVACPAPSRDFEKSPVGQYPRTTAGWQRHTLAVSSSTDQSPSRKIGHWGSGLDTASDPVSLLNGAMATAGFGFNDISGTSLRGDYGKQGEVGLAVYGRRASMNQASLGDWTNGLGNYPDGGKTTYPDQFYATLGARGGASATELAYIPYFAHVNTGDDVSKSADFFSPGRQVSSAINLFGTLSTTDTHGRPQPWQTLLFCPNPAAGTGHPGFGQSGSKVPDHVIADLFWMPVVEPYAISEPLSTAGKVNLNYQIIPFTDITRKTGLYAVMKPTKITAIPSSDASVLADYKSAYKMRSSHAGVSTRLNIDVNETLKAFDTKFAEKDIFRSASQICEMFLVPAGETLANVQGGGFWSGQKLTGDNSREAPYGHIYPRVTTKSNTFQIHYKVQVLKKRSGSDQTLWEEGKDKVVSECRGSTILERFLDPNDSRLKDFATLALTDPDAVIDKYYRFRVVSSKLYNP